jgi:hypothetical protein
VNADPITVTVVSRQWEPVGRENPADLLLGTLVVNGCHVHLEAIRVVDEEGFQTAADPDYAADLDAAYAINGDGPFQTATINVDGTDHQYVIVATGFAD